MNKKIIITLGMFLLLCSPVFAKGIDFYYSPSCSHCQQVNPFVQGLSQFYPINFIDVTKGSYNIGGVPLMIIHTKDGRNIELTGSRDIPKYSICEINEVSSLGCETYSASEGCEKDTQSWFIR